MELNKKEYQIPSEIGNYLKKYGNSNWKLESYGNQRYKLAVVIPAIQEYNNIIKLISSLEKIRSEFLVRTIFIFVINSIVNSNQEIIDDNNQTIKFIQKLISQKQGKLNIAYVDANSIGLQMPVKDGGVGLARKIGIDLSLTIFDYDNNQHKNIILWLDADCTIDENYISEVWKFFNSTNYSAGCVKFKHLLPEDEKEKLAIICYEIFLRYYVLGLKTAKSPYAFHTIGSTLACDVNSYIKIQGMNKKKAGEDFYFIEKLAKITSIGEIKSTCVYPSSRSSWRVPFGTGRSVSRFLQNKQNEYLLYSPKSFYVLKEWLNIFENNKLLSPSEYLNQAKEINSALKTFLVNNNFEKDWEKILLHSKTNEQIKKQKRLWFDGFRTLKFIHYLRDNAYQNIDMFDAVVELLSYNKIEYKIKKHFPNVDEQIEILELLRSIA